MRRGNASRHLRPHGGTVVKEWQGEFARRIANMRDVDLA